jgi:hypothetical protein
MMEVLSLPQTVPQKKWDQGTQHELQPASEKNIYTIIRKMKGNNKEMYENKL